MKNARQQMNAAVACQKQGKLHESVRILDEILATNATFVPALTMRGMLFLQSQQYPAAAGKFEHVLKIEHKNHLAHESLARCLLHMGHYERARQHFETAVRIKPDSVASIMGLGNVLMAQQDYATALTILSRVKSAANAGPGLYLNLGLINEKLGHIDEAIVNYTMAIKLAPGSPNGDLCLGKLYLAGKNFALAETHFTRAIELGARDAETEVCLAQSMLRGGKDELAREHFFKAAERDPRFQGAYVELDNFLLLSGSDEKKQLIEELSRNHIYASWQEALSDAARLGALYEYPDADSLDTLRSFWQSYQPGELHDRTWWQSELGRFGDPLKGHDKVLRGVHSAVFSWSLPDSETLASIAEFAVGTRLRSYGAGSGLWERLLQDHFDVAVAATDGSLRHRFLEMAVEDFSSAQVVESDTIFLAWIIAGNTSVLNIFERMHPNQKLVLIGEPPPRKQVQGICASPAVFAFLDKHFILDKTIRLVSYSRLNDTCCFYRKA